MNSKSRYSYRSGFSLVEVSIAMAIAAVALIALVGMIPAATKGSADSADQTAIGTMFEDIEDRISNNVLQEGPLDGSPFFYDLRGSYIDPDSERSQIATITTDRFYRVEVQLVRPISSASTNFEEAHAVQVKIFWPIDEQGEAIFSDKPGSEVTFLAGAQTGPGWTEVDDSYQPKIEY